MIGKPLMYGLGMRHCRQGKDSGDKGELESLVLSTDLHGCVYRQHRVLPRLLRSTVNAYITNLVSKDSAVATDRRHILIGTDVLLEHGCYTSPSGTAATAATAAMTW